jgi:DNA-binding NtrC family response regulator
MSATTPALFVGLAGDAPHSPPARISLADTDQLELGRAETRSIKRADKKVTVSLPDPRMSTHHARLSKSAGRWLIEDLDSKNGTTVGPDRIKRRPLADGDVIICGHTAFVYREAAEPGDHDGAPAEIAVGVATFHAPFAERLHELAPVASTNRPIEIGGETGLFKELIASSVHHASGRSGAFVAIGCTTLTETLHEDLIRDADRGTLFLDDIAELGLPSQDAVLRVLQDDKLDIRLVSATHRDLDDEVSVDKFRAELRDRLLGFEIELPPLRRRREDLGILVGWILSRHAPTRAVTFSTDAVAALYVHDWPLNLRELERSLSMALAATADRVEMQHLPASVGATEPIDQPVFREVTPEEKSLKEKLASALQRLDGNIAAVGREMGKDPTQIRRWMKRFGIKRD